ncbi:uncharacterized protein LOC110465094 [Mizuhopecten yessoensis]|uniref:Uncharacterized protein n=1 Tax=Mizuhopecten yessoensis TaxID=6573 RepID=A0A210R789_MIZYE|nr:uncharacterized protein LOC110465094 [Mizuhopecten yessoensis]OWF56862.1 hypothetical protein KP79_PYT20212 [Mizuhopecten yessoensis]
MKVLVALTLCLALTSTANGSGFLDSLKASFSHIGDAFTQSLHVMGQQATDVGKQLLNQAAEHGKQLLGETAQSLLLGTMNAFSATSAPATKRDLSAITQQLTPFYNLAHATIGSKSHELQGVFQSAMGRLEEISQHITQLSPEEIAAQVDNVVASHHVLANHLLHELQSALTSHQKRNVISDTLSSIGNNIASVFTTHVHAVENILHNTGSVIKQESATIAQSMAETLGQLSGKLAKQVVHIGSTGRVIANQGSNVLHALKDVMSGVMHQALSDVQPDVLN